MKKIFVVILVIGLVLALAGITMAAGWSEEKLRDMQSGKVVQMKTTAMSDGESYIQVQRSDGGVDVTIYKIKITPEGDTRGKGLLVPEIVGLKSGILASKGKASKDQYFFHEKIMGDSVTFHVVNYAKDPKVNMPVIENIYGDGIVGGKAGSIVLNPNDPWVAYKRLPSGEPDLNTLVISIGMCPNGEFFPGKLAGEKKKEDVYPEYAGYCDKLAAPAKK